MYAKLINDELIPAPTSYRGIINYNKYPERMAEDDYKEVVYSDMPKDGYAEYNEETGELIKEAEKVYKAKYTIKKNKIVQTWIEDKA